jgi:hypothetical protein
VAGDTSCRIDEQHTYSGGSRDAFAVTIAATPATLEGRLQLIVGQVETLSDRGVLDAGDFAALVQQLEGAISALARGDTAGTAQSLQTFVGKVEGLRDRGALTAAEADDLSSAAQSIVAQL